MNPLGGGSPIGGVLGRAQGAAIPNTLDTFTAANNTNINGRTPDIGKSGAVWSVASGTILIQSNRAVSSGTATAVIDCGRSDGILTLSNVRLADAANNYVYVDFRWTNAANCWRLALSPDRGASNDWFLISITAGVSSVPAQGQLNFATGTVHQIAVALNGNSIVVSVDGSQIASVSSSYLASVQTHGFSFGNASNQYVDSFAFAAL